MRIRFLLAALSIGLGLSSAQAIPEGPIYPLPQWFLREEANLSKTTQAPLEQSTNPIFLGRLALQGLSNDAEWLTRALDDPSWIDLRSGNTAVTPVCATWGGNCAGDPFRYPEASGLDGDHFYEEEAEAIPVVFYDDGCARLSGRVWAPRDDGSGRLLAGIVLQTGSIQAPEPAYWWAAQALVRAGYMVMTFDSRGQGRSDFQTPGGEQGSNLNPIAFATNMVNAIDFFRSDGEFPYPHNAACEGFYPTEATPFNPLAERLDLGRLGIAGHSLGANSVMKVQAYGAPGMEPWPGVLDEGNPVDVAVAFDSSTNPHIGGGGTLSNLLLDELVLALIAFPPTLVPRVPLMSQQSEYGFLTAPFLLPENPEKHKVDYRAWKSAGVPIFQFTSQGSTHFEWSQIPELPATSWCPRVENGRCVGGWGRPMYQHYLVAWFDRWLKVRSESGYCDADARLLADSTWRSRYSFYFRSARSFPDRNRKGHVCEDIRAGCLDTAVSPSLTCR